MSIYKTWDMWNSITIYILGKRKKLQLRPINELRFP